MASKVVRARLDPASEDALSVLVSGGLNESEAVRAALVEAGQRRRRRSALRAEVDRLARGPQDAAACAALLADFEPASPEWPT